MPGRDRLNPNGSSYSRGLIKRNRPTEGDGGTYPVALLPRWFPVATTDWGDDDGSGSPVTPTYTRAPDEGTIKYVDIEHNFNTDTATAVAYADTTTGRRFLWFFDQCEVDSNTLRIWLYETPPNDVEVRIVP